MNAIAGVFDIDGAVMDILEAIAIELPCGACGGRYEIRLKQVTLSQQMCHEGCPVPSQFSTECPPMYYADVVDGEELEELQRTWQQLEHKVNAVGGKLVLHWSQNRC